MTNLYQRRNATTLIIWAPDHLTSSGISTLSVHKNIKPFHCGTCDMQFAQNAELNSHMQNKHVFVQQVFRMADWKQKATPENIRALADTNFVDLNFELEDIEFQ